MEKGPSFGYFPEPSKSVLVVDSKFSPQAKDVFDEYRVKVVQSSKLLGGVIGDEESKSEFVDHMVEKCGCSSWRVLH